MSEPSALTATPIAIAIVRRGSEVLVGTRPAHLPLGGRAEFPGGKCAPQETPEEAAVRECFEETGLLVYPKRKLCEVVCTYPHDRVHLTFVECAPVDQAEPQPPFCWIPIARLRECSFPQANEPVLRILEQEVGGT